MNLNVWKATLRSIEKLQFLNWPGSTARALLGATVGLASLYTEINETTTLKAGMVAMLWRSISFLDLVILALMPLAIYHLSPYAKEIDGKLTGPSKLFWIFLLSNLPEVTFSILFAVTAGNSGIPYLLVNTIRCLFLIIYGWMVGCFCTTLESRFKVEAGSPEGAVFKQVTDGLQSYQAGLRIQHPGGWVESSSGSCFRNKVGSGL